MVKSKKTKNQKEQALTEYMQGSVWMWRRDETEQANHKEGVQSSGRPVLIISNNLFNLFSPAVNCLTITGVLRHNPAHVPVLLDIKSHIQCEQVHTITKSELTQYKGVVSPIVLSTVKEKLKMQFDMNTDKSLEILMEIKRSIDGLNQKAGIFQAPEEEQDEYLDEYEEDPITIHEDKNVTKPKRRKYSDEDIAFILDDANSIGKIMEKLGIQEKRSAYSTRSYFRKKYRAASPKVVEEPIIAEPITQGKRRKYTDDDKRFIVDAANPINEIMERFGYKNKAAANRMRAYFKKRLR